ncbi:hypothetical protein [Paraflavitalea pollutisoli]|uniref:hypothetical protein n=1 Tax=Paraflavitalea pollutisoli TaxID=3034143 RepID=UPI0023EE22DA|nr:hypothetical protein [Paraflavitalea sp. H1-2-19X]
MQLWAFIGTLDLPVMCFPPDPPPVITFIRQVIPFAGPGLVLLLTTRLSRKRGWAVANTILGLLLSVLFYYYGPNFPLINDLVLDIGTTIIPLWIAIFLYGSLLLSIALLLIYSRAAISFIETGRISSKPATDSKTTTT